MTDALGAPAQTLRTMHTLFVGQVADGDLEIDVEILRHGRSMSHLRAHVRSQGTTNGHITTAVFGASREGFDFTELRPPEVPLPEDCPWFRDPPPPGVPAFTPTPFWATSVEGRAAIGVAPWEVVENRTAEQATWYRFDDTPWIDNGTRLDPFAIVLLADTMPGAIGQRVGPTGRQWFGPSVDSPCTCAPTATTRGCWDTTLHVGRAMDTPPSTWRCGIATHSSPTPRRRPSSPS